MRSTSSADRDDLRLIGDTPVVQPAFMTSASLPQPLTSFVGRKSEVDEVVALLAHSGTRLLTLTGPGGVGKTRLAIEVASAIARERDVVFVPLVSVGDPELVSATIGAAFGLSDQVNRPLAERLAAVIGDVSILLVLDNFEHVIDVAPVVAELLMACQMLTILATSRRELRISGEVTFSVPPLETPGASADDEEIERSPAGRLFIERARPFVNGPGGQRWDHAEMRAVAEICNRLDGLPLAIELAAARSRVLPPSELLKRLDRSLSLLTDGPVDAPTRLRSMTDAIGWSYDLLNDDEKRLFRTLGVFAGGFTVDAVESVAPDYLERAPLNLLTQLIDHSLVQRMASAASTARFTLLETVREFALVQLRAREEESAARQRHLNWMVSFVGDPTPDQFDDWRGPADATLLEQIDNLRLAFGWALDQNDTPRAAQIAWGMLRIWWHFGLTAEALVSVRRLAEHPDALDPLVYATVLGWCATLANYHGDYVRMESDAAASVEMFRRLGYTRGVNRGLIHQAQTLEWIDPMRAVELSRQVVVSTRAMDDVLELAWDLVWRSSAVIASGDAQSAVADLEEAIAIFGQFPDRDEVRFDHAVALSYAAWAFGVCGDMDRASQLAAEGFAFSQRFNVAIGEFHANRVLGELARVRGDLEKGRAHLLASLMTTHREALEGWNTFVVIQVAMLCQAAGGWRAAARLFGYADAYWTRHSFAESAHSVAAWGYRMDPTLQALGEEEFARQRQAGGQLSSAAAFAEASSFVIPVKASNQQGSLLTRREREVLLLLAAGKTNQEIAADLFVGKSTVDTHVAHILAKLDVESRRDAVRVARERGLLSS